VVHRLQCLVVDLVIIFSCIRFVSNNDVNWWYFVGLYFAIKVCWWYLVGVQQRFIKVRLFAWIQMCDSNLILNILKISPNRL